MKPLDYLSFKRDDIFENLSAGNFHSGGEVQFILQMLESTTNKLIPVRHSEYLTEMVLNELEILPDNIMRSVKHWLVKALIEDDTYVYAYNPLAQFSNRQTGFTHYQIKYISDSELFLLLKEEEEVIKHEMLKYNESNYLPNEDHHFLESWNSIESSQKLESPEQILSEIEKKENKFWRGLPMKIVISHFEVMTERTSKNGEKFLTKMQLISFLKKGFLKDESQPIQKINCSDGEKGFVILRFYEFYDIAVAKYSHPRSTKKFISLLTDCFDNWEEESIRTLFKRGRTKEKW